MLDRTDFQQVFDNKLDRILAVIEEAKKEGKSSVIYQFYIPQWKHKQFDGFKAAIIEAVKKNGNHITDFLPGAKPEFHGHSREMFICWTDESRAEVENKEGYQFR